MDEGGWVTRRQEPRTVLAISCEILGGFGRAVARLRDLSPGGCRIDAPSRAVAHDLLIVTLRPDFMESVDFAAEVRWVGKELDLQGIGCRFIHSPRSRERLSSVLSRLARPAPALSTKKTRRFPKS